MTELRNLVRDVAYGGHDPWDTLVELGLTTVGVPEGAGGSGGTVEDLVEIVAALSELGVHTPLAEHATACWAMADTGLLPGLGTVAFSGEASPDRLRATVPWASRATHVVILSDEGFTGVVDLRADGLEITSGSDVAGGSLDLVEGSAPSAPLAVSSDDVAARLGLLRSAAIVAAARGAYDLTRAHVRTREQFGRALVSLPAVSTALARFRVEIIQAEAALAGALANAGTQRGHGSVSVARIVCGAAATEAARLAHQLNGAMGITQEYGLHPLTRLLWTLRDADRPEEYWARSLGEIALEQGESHLWDQLTSVVST